MFTMYMGEPHNVAAITPSSRNRANPKSAVDTQHSTSTDYQQFHSTMNHLINKLSSELISVLRAELTPVLSYFSSKPMSWK